MEARSGLITPPMLKPGDMAVYPAHGVGEILGIEQRDAGGKTAAYYVLKIIETGSKIMVAVASADAGGLRSVMSSEEAMAVLKVLRAPEMASQAQPWNRRQRVYAEMLKSGLPLEIAKVLRDMSRRREDKDLSFAERKLLDQARALLLHELALATGQPRAALEAELRTIFAA
jgi:CarD family transcriptional regulator